MLSSPPMLKPPDFNKGFILFIDASMLGIGAVLTQIDDSEVERPVAYFSRKLNQHQIKYSTVEKECLALVLAVEHFAIYLTCGQKVIVYSDHNPLVFLNKMKEKNKKLLRWNLYLDECLSSDSSS